MTPDQAHLRSIKTFPQLVSYLRDELDWPIATDDFDELTFEYSADELGLDHATAVKVKEIKQLRPLTAKQPWGIFFVNFEPKRLPVVALRRILSTLVIRKRQSANKSQQASWRLHDLLFISSYGESEHREITFAHFSDDSVAGDLPTLRVLGWDDEDTKLHVDHVEAVLREKLHWPSNVSDLESWRTKWSSGFTLRHREVITTSIVLAERLADLARSIRKRTNTVLKVESDTGPFRKLHDAFKQALIHDLSEDDFADMYAQTISYGLLTAQVSRPAGLVANNLSDMVPVTNPFLKELLETFLTAGGRKGKIDFDELGVSEVVQLLRDADMEAVLRDFGDRNPQEDPVIHFYELFLKEYDAKKRMQRGVFYTPRPVVSFIVRSVHEILQKEFGLEDGLADTTTWDEMLVRKANLRPPQGASGSEPFVQILDPATGTGTFLVEAIDVIYNTMEARWSKQGYMPLEFQRLWNEYVPKHLLPRLYGFELMMAPYAIAHMKIGLKLFETGYRFETNERARVYLTNSLEPATDLAEQRAFEQWAPALANEALAVNTVKGHRAFTVVIGNPPYAAASANFGEWICHLLEDYYSVDGAPLGEKNPKNLQDDYVKFIRLGQYLLRETNSGVFSFITNHGYIANPTFRGMRRSLVNDFGIWKTLDLHGSTKKKEYARDGSSDENVFDIQQGVAIFHAVKLPIKRPILSHADLYGDRQSKYTILQAASAGSISWQTVSAIAPFYLFQPQDTDVRAEYYEYMSIAELMPLKNYGFKTHRDHYAISFTEEEMIARITELRSKQVTDEEIRRKYNVGETVDWKLERIRTRLRGNPQWRSAIHKCCYRPFDFRYCYLSTDMMDRPRFPFMNQILAKNHALATTRTVEIQRGFEHVGCVTIPMDHHAISLKESNYLFPLYSYPLDGELGIAERTPNFAPQAMRALCAKANIKFNNETGFPENFTPENVFQYVFAVLHSMAYRKRYAEFLKIDFPRVPLTVSLELFYALTKLGKELIALHLLQFLHFDNPTAMYEGPSNPEVERVSYLDKTVWLNKAQTCGFSSVPENVWDFHIGGYQVCEKWLKDRKGRKLSKADIEHYQKIVVALHETIRIMAEIDTVINAHGGWPGAFVNQETARKSTFH